MLITTKLSRQDVETVVFLCSYMENEFASVRRTVGIDDMLGRVDKLRARMASYERERLADEGD